MTTRGLTFEIVDVTPAIAQDWLNLNREDNRRISDPVVSHYAETMRRGEWNGLTGEAIKFSASGRLDDGQHRLLAVIRSGVTVTFLVCRGIPEEAFHVIDQGRSRPKLWYEDASARKTVNALLRYHDGAYGFLRATQGELQEVLDRHRAAIRFSNDLFAYHCAGVSTAPNMAIVTRASYHHDAYLLEEFVECLYARRVASSPNRQLTAQKVLAFLSTAQTNGGSKDHRTTTYRKVERALRAFLVDEPVRKLYEAPGELFPLPEEAS